jgi:CHAT domain
VEIDWLARPVETMSYLATPHHQSMLRWFQIALARKSEERAIEIAELIRRQRFFSALPMGGRLVALRWVLEAPEGALSDNGKKQKQELLVRYPQWNDLSSQSASILKELEALPINTANNSPERTAQKKLLESLANVTNQQEMLIRKLSMMREPVELAFPRPLKVPEIQQRLTPDQMMILYLKAGDSYHVMSLSKDRYQIEGMIPARELEKKIGELLKQIGVGEKSAVYEAGQLASDKWQETARSLSAMVFPGSSPERFATAKELIVVPDGLLWYLPFEILQKGAAGQTSNLIDSVRIRYAPIASLGVPDERVSRRFGKKSIVAKRNFNRDKPEQIAAAVEEMQRLFPDIQTLEATMLLPSAIASSLVDQLIVWHDHRDKNSARDGVFGLSPMQVDDGKPGSSLASWMELPWRGIDQFVWTGLSSEVEGSTRSKADGSDLFLISTALMASGTRTALLSRWRVGGQSAVDLSREFLQELPRLPACEAWQRSVRLFREAEMDLSAESRVREEKLEKPLTGQAPFFWSGYLLIDGGGVTEKSGGDVEQGNPPQDAAREGEKPPETADKKDG